MKAIITSDKDLRTEELGLRLVSEGANDLVLMRMLERRYPAIFRSPSTSGTADLAVPILAYPDPGMVKSSGAVVRLTQGHVVRGPGDIASVPTHSGLPGQQILVAWTNSTQLVVRDLRAAFADPERWFVIEVVVNGRVQVGQVEDVVPGALVNLLVGCASDPIPTEVTVEIVGTPHGRKTTKTSPPPNPSRMARLTPFDVTLWAGRPVVDVVVDRAAGADSTGTAEDLSSPNPDEGRISLPMAVSESPGMPSHPPGPTSVAVAVGESVEFSAVVDSAGLDKLAYGDVVVTVESGAEFGIVDIAARYESAESNVAFATSRYIMAGNGEVRAIWLRDRARGRWSVGDRGSLEVYGCVPGHGPLGASDLVLGKGDTVYVTVTCLRSACRVVSAEIVGRADSALRRTKSDPEG